jgi:hypothetical protein
MFRNALAAFAACSLFLFAACDQYGVAGPRGTGQVRLVNVAPQAPPLSLTLGGAALVAGVAYPSGSAYLDVPGGIVNTYEVRNSIGVVVAQQSFTAEDRADYSLVFYGSPAQPLSGVLRDDTTPPQPGTARLRLINVAGALSAVDLYVTAVDTDLAGVQPTAPTLNYGNFTNYLSVNAGVIRIRATSPGTKTVVLDSGPLSVSSLSAYSGYLVEATGGGAPYNVLLLGSDPAALPSH